jgi:hypothetical protein
LEHFIERTNIAYFIAEKLARSLATLPSIGIKRPIASAMASLATRDRLYGGSETQDREEGVTDPKLSRWPDKAGNDVAALAPVELNCKSTTVR